VATGVEVFDWYTRSGRPRGPGFLVDFIRRPDEYPLPPGFESSADRRERKRAADSRNAASREMDRLAEAKERANRDARWRAFTAVWGRLPDAEKVAFEGAALAAATATKRDGYHRLRPVGGPVFEQYRRIVLLDHFDRTRPAS
jgi:hypothetical protein